MGNDGVVPKTREQVRLAAAMIDIRFNTVRQWFHRGRIPPLAELQLIDYFGNRFFVVDHPIQTSGRPCLARLARSYIRR